MKCPVLSHDLQINALKARTPKTTFLPFLVFPLRPSDIVRAPEAMGFIFQTTLATLFKLLSL